LEKRVDELEEKKAESKEHHTKRREQIKSPTKQNKQKWVSLKMICQRIDNKLNMVNLW